MLKKDKKLQEEDTFERPYRIGFVPVPGFAFMSYASISEPFRAANLLSGRSLYDVRHYGVTPFVSSSGSGGIGECRPYAEEEPPDLLMIIAGGDPFAVEDSALFCWLTHLAGKGVRLGGVSGGPVILARAGVMSGRRMTVHWEHAAELAERSPDLIIERRLYIVDRDRVTCGGGVAPMDFAHALLRERHGGAFARLVSDWFLHTDIRAAAAPQRTGSIADEELRSRHLPQVISAMQDHIADPLSLSQLALMSELSSRQLNRLFQGTFQVSAMLYYRNMRLDVARRLLRNSTMNVAEIAEATGFASTSHLSSVYVARFDARPSRDRVVN